MQGKAGQHCRFSATELGAYDYYYYRSHIDTFYLNFCFWRYGLFPGRAQRVISNERRRRPDSGEGYQMLYPNIPWQTYITNLTSDEAKKVKMGT